MNYQTNQDVVTYLYKGELVESLENEIIEKRTANARYFKSEKPNQLIAEYSIGNPYYQDTDDKWYYINSATTTEQYFAIQTKATLLERIFGKKALADVVDVQLSASGNDGSRDSGTFDTDNSYDAIGWKGGSRYLETFYRWDNVTIAGTLKVI